MNYCGAGKTLCDASTPCTRQGCNYDSKYLWTNEECQLDDPEYPAECTPTPEPTAPKTPAPTFEPTGTPTLGDTPQPTVAKAAEPTAEPTFEPTRTPTLGDTP